MILNPDSLFTVVIPTRNRSDLVYELIKYLRVDLKWCCTIVVVDQSDDDGSGLSHLLDEHPLKSVLHIIDERRGTSRGRNLGALKTETEWLLFLDDDVRPEHNYLKNMHDYIQENNWVDVVHLGLEQADEWEVYCKNTDVWCARKYKKDRALRLLNPRMVTASNWFTNSPASNYESMTIGIASGNFAIKRKVFQTIGGFDEQIDGFGEDRELGVRLWWYGYRVVYYPGATAFHLRAAHGGIRTYASRWNNLLAPEPPPGWLYFYLKWFPGKPFREMVAYYILKWAKRPWTLPIKFIRIWHSFKIAKERISEGPIYIETPTPRSQCDL